MHDVVGVRLSKASGDLSGNVKHLREGNLAPKMNALGQCPALVEGHDDESVAVRSLIDPVDRADIHVVERGSDPGFLQDSLFVFLTGVEPEGQELKGDRTFQLQVAGTIDD